MNILEVVQSVMLLVALKAFRGKQSGDEVGDCGSYIESRSWRIRSKNSPQLVTRSNHRIMIDHLQAFFMTLRYQVKSDSAYRVGQRKPSQLLQLLQTTYSSPKKCYDVSCSTPLCALVGCSGSRRRVRWFPLTKVVESHFWGFWGRKSWYLDRSETPVTTPDSPGISPRIMSTRPAHQGNGLTPNVTCNICCQLLV